MEPCSLPELTREADDLIFQWAADGVCVIVRDIASSASNGPRAEVWAQYIDGDHLHAAMLNLLSTSSKRDFIKAAAGKAPQFNWAAAVEQFSVEAVRVYREGDPLEILEPRRRAEAGRYAVDPLAPLAQLTLWYGDGKTCKSYLLTAACRAMMTGTDVAGMRGADLTPAFLDWEWDQSEHADRLLRLGGDTTFFYQRCTVPLQDQAKALKRKLDRQRVDFIGVDSLGLACGGDPSDPKIALPFFSALRYLGRTAVVIHHVPKMSKDPYGSVYIRNSTRAGWYFARHASVDEDSAHVALVNRWSNVGRLQRPIGIRFLFDDAQYTTAVLRADAGEVLALTGDLEPKAAIERVLRLLPLSTVEEIAAEIGAPPEKTRVHLSQLKRQKRVTNPERGKWALIEQHREAS